MITVFNRKEVYNGFSMQEYAAVRDSLGSNNIKYTCRCVDTSNPGFLPSSRTGMGRFGENMKYLYQYYIYVHKTDYDEACYLISQK